MGDLDDGRLAAADYDLRVVPLRLGTFAGFVAAAAVGVFVVALAASTPARSSPTAGRRVIAFYTVKLGIKGGETLNLQDPERSASGVVTEVLAGSYSIDGTLPTAMFTGASPARGVPTSMHGQGYKAVVHGSWNTRGEWYDEVSKSMKPFACSGTITTHVPAAWGLGWTRHGSTILFTLEAAQQELYENGYDSCPDGTYEGPASSGTGPIVFDSHFSLPVAAIGRKTITAQVSGPLTQNRKSFLQNCASAKSTCNMAWHGVVIFTLKRLMTVP